MTTTPRILSALALLSLLAACGNKGALIKPSQIQGHAPPGQSIPVPSAADEAKPVPVPADDGGDGNG